MHNKIKLLLAKGKISCTHDKMQTLGLQSLTYSKAWLEFVLFFSLV